MLIYTICILIANRILYNSLSDSILLKQLTALHIFVDDRPVLELVGDALKPLAHGHGAWRGQRFIVQHQRVERITGFKRAYLAKERAAAAGGQEKGFGKGQRRRP